jgi:hypothetical protein
MGYLMIKKANEWFELIERNIKNRWKGFTFIEIKLILNKLDTKCLLSMDE